MREISDSLKPLDGLFVVLHILTSQSSVIILCRKLSNVKIDIFEVALSTKKKSKSAHYCSTAKSSSNSSLR